MVQELRLSNLRASSSSLPLQQLLEKKEKKTPGHETTACRVRNVSAASLQPPSPPAPNLPPVRVITETFTGDFRHAKKEYTSSKTFPGRASGLHALMGKKDEWGNYFFYNARTDFLKRLFTQQKENALFRQFLLRTLQSYLGPTPSPTAKKIFSSHRSIPSLKESLVSAKNEEDKKTLLQTFIATQKTIGPYFLACTTPQYIFDESDLEIAAHVFGKKLIIQSKESKEKKEKPREYGSGDETVFIYHDGINYLRCEEIRPPPQSLILHQQNPRTDHLDALADFDDDALPSGVLSARGELVAFHSHGKDEAILEIRLQAPQRYYLQLCQQSKGNPALLLALANNPHLSKFQAADFQSQALEELTKSGEQEIKTVQRRLEKEAKSNKGEQESEALPKLMDNESAVKEKAGSAKEKREKLNKKWREKLKNYYKKCGELFRNGGKDKQVEEFQHMFDALRKLKPESFAPFYPFLTLLVGRCETHWLKQQIAQAHQCDPYQTYALTIYFMRLSQTGENRPIFSGYSPLKVLSILKELYPDDLMIPLFMNGIKSASFQFSLILPSIAACLRDALSSLASKNTKSAIHILVKHKPLLMGYATLHRCLALAWTIEGDFQKADQIFNRASLLPDIHESAHNGLSQQFIHLLGKVFPEKFNNSPLSVQEKEDPLKFLIVMANKQPLDIKKAHAFIKSLTCALQSDVQHLPTAYFGVQWLAARLVTNPTIFYRELFESLVELMSRTASICHESGHELDPWIDEYFEKKVSGDDVSFIVCFPRIGFGFPEPDKLPTFNFLNHLVLAKESVNSLALCLTKKTYSLLLSLMTAHIAPAYIAEHESLLSGRLPHDATIFLKLLQVGFTSKIEKHGKRTVLFDCCVNHLNEYFRIPPAERPYPIDPAILEWAKFCVFSTEPPSFSTEAMEKEIEKSCYSKDFSKDGFEKALTVVKHSFRVKVPDLLLGLAIRDVLLAHHHLARTHQSVSIQTHDSIYSLFRTSQRLFGWRTKESFNEWGERLKQAREFGPAASQFHLMGHISLDLYPPPSSSPPDFEGNINSKIQGFLRLFLEFWIAFHNKTKEKNDYIAKGGNEEDPKSEEKNWHKGMDLKEWVLMVKNNCPEKYPNFKKLSQKETSDLKHLLQEKHHHVNIISKLKQLCKRPNYIPPAEFANYLAMLVVVNAEDDRQIPYSHSIFVESEDQARQVYQILLEVSVDRVVRQVFRVGGIENWIGADPTSITKILAEPLKSLIGAFHGPEEHLSGNGPLQKHYNAGVVISTLAVVNTHIYF